MIAMGVAFVGCFAGASYIWGNGTPAPIATAQQKAPPKQQAFVSKLDRQCGSTWKSSSSNIDELHCYMTTNITRLCDPRERAHMMETITRFEKDYASYDMRFKAAAMQTAASAFGNSMQLGMMDAQMHRAATEEEKLERMGQIMERVGDIMAPAHNVMTEKRNRRKLHELTPALSALVTDGYVSAKDFKGRQSQWMREAFSKARAPSKSCD